MNLIHHLTSALLIAVIVSAAAALSHAVPTDYQDSVAFDYRYEFGSVDPGNAAHIDLDGDGLPDLEAWQSPTLNSAAGSVELNPSGSYADAYLNTHPDLGSVWHNTDIDYNTGYTIEFRAKAGVPMGENTYSSGVLATANGTNQEFWLVYGPNGQGWGADGAITLGSNDNAADYHTFRVASTPGGMEYWIWRDGQLLNPDAAPLPATATFAPRMAFGGIASTCLGSSELDYFRFTSGTYLPPGAAPLPVPPPGPIEVEKELYVAHYEPGRGADLMLYENAPGVYEEKVTYPTTADPYGTGYMRRTYDNGKTWSEPVGVESPFHYEWDEASQTDIRVYWGTYARVYDPEHERTVSMWLRQSQMNPGSWDYPNHSFARSSADLGVTWSEPTLLKYEPGGDFDPDDPFQPSFLNSNTGYFPASIIRHSNGTIIAPLGDVNDPGNPSSQRSGLCFIGQWDEQKDDYTWTAGERVTVPSTISSSGLDEPDLAELSDGRVLVVWRTSASADNPGRRWYTVSDDGGQTLSDVQEMKYDDGTSFYSPASYCRMIRHSVTGKLYWIGNICEGPPSGNLPRYPLVIAEIDEENLALVRDSVTIVDQKLPGDSTGVQLTNFPVVENPETHDFELYMYRIGADPSDFWGNDCYKYTISFSNVSLPGDANCDGVVDEADATILATNWQTSLDATWVMGDFNLDGHVNDADATILAANWQTTNAPPASVPEPSTLMLLLTAAVGCVLARIRHN